MSQPVRGEALDAHAVARVFARVHDAMRDGDGLGPRECLDELLKLLLLAQDDAPEESAPGAPLDHGLWLRRRWRRAREGSGPSGQLDLGELRLSDRTLGRVGEELEALRGLEDTLDLQSAALRELLATTLRRGLGIYLTPDPVVRLVVEALDPKPGVAAIDPACGAGSFLLQLVWRWQRLGLLDRGSGGPPLFGVERSAPILRIAEVSLIPRLGKAFHRWCGDALSPFGASGQPQWFRPGRFDLVMTNPPFGVRPDMEQIRGSDFTTGLGDGSARVGAEVLFVERSLELLRPDGRLAVVVPRGLVTNVTCSEARRALDRLGELQAVVSLPPETFAITGTQSATSVLFFRRRRPDEGTSGVGRREVYHARVDNVGYDATGRLREGSTLGAVLGELAAVLSPPRRRPRRTRGPEVGLRLRLPRGRELSAFSELRSAPTGRGLTLGDCARLIRTGRTPPRRDYTESGRFIVKVGNLTGAGIEWFARERNFVSPAYVESLERSTVAEELLLRQGDLLLTSSAHALRYIARKVDLVDELPSFVTGPCPFVGELLLIRPDPERIDPYYLLAFLRSDQAGEALRAMARGQTAHLAARDARTLPVPTPEEVGLALATQLASTLREEQAARARSIERRATLQELTTRAFLPH